jgi:hypothetical protein
MTTPTIDAANPSRYPATRSGPGNRAAGGPPPGQIRYRTRAVTRAST